MRKRIVAGIAALAALGGVTIGTLSARAADTQTNSTFEPLSPARILDTRTSGQIGPDSTLDLQVIGQGGVPAGATAVVVNLTVTEPDSSSYLTLWPTGEARPEVSNINFVAGRTIANLVTAKLSPEGKLSIYNFAGNVDVLIDVNGYYHPSTAGTGPTSNPGLAGYEIVTNNTGAANPRIASCPKGKKVIGGGAVQASGNTGLAQSYPNSDSSWASNGTATYAICVSA